MADKTKIEWTDASWTPIRARNKKTGKVGWHCEHATTGCEHCYAEGMNKRLGTGLPFKPGHRADIEIFLDPDMLLAPLRWKKPRMIFVCSMTDLFADFVPDEMIDQVFAVMALCPQHTFQVLTKRAERMRDYMTGNWQGRMFSAIRTVQPPPEGHGVILKTAGGVLENVWLGVSTERQKEADERIPFLLQTPAAVRFISAEPLLGPITLPAKGRYVVPVIIPGKAGIGIRNLPQLDWVIVGGESGHDARPVSIQWVRELRDQCKAAGAAFFFKQWGEWRPAGMHPAESPGRFAFGDYEHDRHEMIQVDHYPRQFTKFGARSVMERVGKKAAGRHLDGITHDAMPSPPDHIIMPPSRRAAAAE